MAVDQEAVSLPARRGALEATGSHTFFLEDLGAGARSAPEAVEGRRRVAGTAGPRGGSHPRRPDQLLHRCQGCQEASPQRHVLHQRAAFRATLLAVSAGGRPGPAGPATGRDLAAPEGNHPRDLEPDQRARDAEDGREERKLRESAEMLSELQGTLMQQAQTLVQRTRARQLTRTDPKFAQFAELLEQGRRLHGARGRGAAGIPAR